MSDVRITNPHAARTYAFRAIESCNMCGADAAAARTLGIRLDGSQGRSPRKLRGVAVSVCRCRTCGTVFTSPQPIPASISDHYGVPPESYWRQANYDVEPGYFARQTATAKRLLDFTPGMKAIDIGVGLGKAARVLRDAGFDVYGIEPSEPFYRKAMEILGESDRFQCASVEEADFPAATFDFVTFGAVLEHLYDPSGSLAKAMEWLRPGGVAHVEVPNADHLVARIINAYYRAAGTSYVTNTSPMHTPYHLHEFTTNSFRRNGDRLGYDVAEYHVDVASIYNLPKVIHPLLRRLMAKSDTGMQLTVWLRKR